mgnify:CR=1 FL=1
MTFDVTSIFILLAVVMALFIWGRWRFDIVAFGALMVATALGIVPADEAFLGFGHPATVTVAAVLIIRSPMAIRGSRAAELPIRIRVFAPMLISSSAAMAAEGQPIPVEVTEIFTPL